MGRSILSHVSGLCWLKSGSCLLQFVQTVTPSRRIADGGSSFQLNTTGTSVQRYPLVPAPAQGLATTPALLRYSD
eukprot:SAG11_NODE_1744_length_4334_cov_32.676033_2_plen_75_part_00